MASSPSRQWLKSIGFLQKTEYFQSRLILHLQPQLLLTDIVEPRTIIVVSEVPQAVTLGGVTVAVTTENTHLGLNSMHRQL